MSHPSPPFDPSDPHSSLFAFAFSHKEHAAGILKASLPRELAGHLEWESLTRIPADFVDANLRWRHSDLLYSVRFQGSKEEVLIYTLLEHQSSPDPLMAYRVLRYLVKIWDEHFKVHPHRRSLSLIVPMVIYHGAKTWNAARMLRELFDAPPPVVQAVTDHVPQSGYRFLDVRGRSADRLVSELLTAFGDAALWAMAMAGDTNERLIQELGRMEAVLKKVTEQVDGQAALGALIRYLFATHEHLDARELRRVIVDAVDAKAGDIVVSTYHEITEAGRKKGDAEGRAGILLHQLAAKFGPVAAEVQVRVQAAAPTEVEAWATRILTAATLSEVFASSTAPKAARGSKKARS